MDAKARILVVDDEEIVRRSYARILGEMDCDARAAADGEQALQLGACDYLAKPTGPDEVINAARGAMRRKKWALRAEAAPVH